MDYREHLLNRFLVEAFYQILRTEELCISRAGYDNLSLKELHVIEAVCRAEEEGSGNRATSIARSLGVTSGTLTTAVSLLEKKGYLIRQRDAEDKRVVRIRPTELGLTANRSHEAFHREMVRDVMNALSEEELEIFLRALGHIGSFFRSKKRVKQEDFH